MEVNKKQLSDIFGVSVRTIQNWQDQGIASGGYVGNASSPASVSPGGVMVNMGGVYISSGNEQQSTQRSAIDSNGILKQLKPAIISVVSEQAQRPGTPLWKAIKEGR